MSAFPARRTARASAHRRPRPAAALLALAALGLGAAPGRAQQPAAAAFQVTVPADTILVPPERFTFGVRAPASVRVVVTVTPAGAVDLPVWQSDTLRVGTGARVAWDLRETGGGWILPGRYVLRVVAFDSAGAAATAARTLQVARLPADTVPLPRRPRPDEFLPETVQVRQTSPWAILIGGAAGLLPTLVGRRELNGGLPGDPKVWIVVGSVTAVGFLAIFTGHRPGFAPENARSNAELMADYLARLAAARADNARARDAAGFRIRAGGAP